MRMLEGANAFMKQANTFAKQALSLPKISIDDIILIVRNSDNINGED